MLKEVREADHCGASKDDCRSGGPNDHDTPCVDCKYETGDLDAGDVRQHVVGVEEGDYHREYDDGDDSELDAVDSLNPKPRLGTGEVDCGGLQDHAHRDADCDYTTYEDVTDAASDGTDVAPLPNETRAYWGATARSPATSPSTTTTATSGSPSGSETSRNCPSGSNSTALVCSVAHPL